MGRMRIFAAVSMFMVLILALAGCQLTPEPEPETGLVAYIEGRIPGREWSHWDVLYTSTPTLELRGTGSKQRSEAEIVRFEWIFGDGDTAEGEYTTHTYSKGTWYITLTVYNQQGHFASQTVRLELN